MGVGTMKSKKLKKTVTHQEYELTLLKENVEQKFYIGLRRENIQGLEGSTYALYLQAPSDEDLVILYQLLSNMTKNDKVKIIFDKSCCK